MLRRYGALGDCFVVDRRFKKFEELLRMSWRSVTRTGDAMCIGNVRERPLHQPMAGFRCSVTQSINKPGRRHMGRLVSNPNYLGNYHSDSRATFWLLRKFHPFKNTVDFTIRGLELLWAYHNYKVRYDEGLTLRRTRRIEMR